MIAALSEPLYVLRYAIVDMFTAAISPEQTGVEPEDTFPQTDNQPLHPIAGQHDFKDYSDTSRIGGVKNVKVAFACMTSDGEYAVAAGEKCSVISVFRISATHQLEVIQAVALEMPVCAAVFSSDEKYLVAMTKDETMCWYEWNKPHDQAVRTDPLIFKVSSKLRTRGVGNADHRGRSAHICVSPAKHGSELSLVAAAGDTRGEVHIYLFPKTEEAIFLLKASEAQYRAATPRSAPAGSSHGQPASRTAAENNDDDDDGKMKKVSSLAMTWHDSVLLLAVGYSAVGLLPSGTQTLDTIKLAVHRVSEQAPTTALGCLEPDISLLETTMDGSFTKDLGGHNVNAVCFSPDGRKLVAGTDDMKVKVFDVITGLLMLDRPFGSRFIDAITFSPFGKDIVVAGGRINGGRVEIYDVGTCVLRRRIYLGGRVRALQWNNYRLFCAGDDGCISICDMHYAQSVMPLMTQHDRAIVSVAISHDCKWMAVGGRQKYEWMDRYEAYFGIYTLGPCSTEGMRKDVSSSCFENNRRTHTHSRKFDITCLAWSLDSREIAVGGKGKYIYLFHIDNLDCPSYRLNALIHPTATELNLDVIRFAPAATKWIDRDDSDDQRRDKNKQFLVAGGIFGEIRFYDVTNGPNRTSNDVGGSLSCQSTGMTSGSMRYGEGSIRMCFPVLDLSFSEAFADKVTLKTRAMFAIVSGRERESSLLLFFFDGTLILHFVWK